MKRRLAFVLTLILSITMIGCQSEKTEASLSDLYIQVFQELIETDSELNGDLEFIAVDFDSIQGLTDDDKDQINEYLAKEFEVDVKNASLQNLKEQGLYDEENLAIIHGVLLKIDTYEENTEKLIKLSASKYKSGKGAAGMQFTFELNGDQWELIDSESTWKS